MCYDSPLSSARSAICIAGDLVRCNDDSPDQSLRCEAAAKLRDMQIAVERLTEELKAQVYYGNSIGYIYDKMLCYKDQVGTMGEIMRTLGQPFDALGNDNIERRFNGLRWAEQIAERLEVVRTGEDDAETKAAENH